jgi:2-methylisocitrate lyase-like PEP mutase family enzyme
MTEIVESVGYLSAAVSAPVIADAEAGSGNALNV